MASQILEPPILCAGFHKASELIGRRWTGAIPFVLLESSCRVATLRSAIPAIVDRMVIPETPVRLEYSLSKKGR